MIIKSSIQTKHKEVLLYSSIANYDFKLLIISSTPIKVWHIWKEYINWHKFASKNFTQWLLLCGNDYVNSIVIYLNMIILQE